MKVSEITTKDIAEYLRLDDDFPVKKLEPLLASARHFVEQYTGLTAEEVDEHEDFCQVIFILCQDMYDNRTLYPERSNLNQVVETILGMHRVNFLGTVEGGSADVY